MSEQAEEKKTGAADGLVPAETARRELTLALLYLNAFFPGFSGKDPSPLTAWKNADFDVLDELDEADFIRNEHRRKSVDFTRKGIGKAREILAKYGIAEWPDFQKQEHLDAFYKR